MSQYKKMIVSLPFTSFSLAKSCSISFVPKLIFGDSDILKPFGSKILLGDTMTHYKMAFIFALR